MSKDALFPTVKQASAEFCHAFPKEKDPVELRNADGTFPKGHKKVRKRLKTHGLSASLQRYMLAKYGSARVYYEWLIEIADPANGEDAKDRLTAISLIAERVDGKPVASVELSGPQGKPVEVASHAAPELTTAQRLAAVAGVLGSTGALTLSRAAGGASGRPHAALEQVSPADSRGEGRGPLPE